jgi:hypothetical protein
MKSQVRQLTQYTFFDIHVPINMDPRENQHLIKRRGVVKVSLTRIQHVVAQFDRLRDKNEIKVHYGPLGEFWNRIVDFSLCWRRMMKPLIMRLIERSMERLLASREAGSLSVTPKL